MGGGGGVGEGRGGGEREERGRKSGGMELKGFFNAHNSIIIYCI